MCLNTTILALRRDLTVNLWPLYASSLLSQTHFIHFHKISSKKSFHSFIFSKISNKNLQITNSLFSNHLSSPIKLLSETYSLLNAHERLNLNQNANTKLSDCSFIKCTAMGKGIDGNGGAIFIFYSLNAMFSLFLERINFVDCVAKSSGGCVFVFNTKFESDTLCFTRCFATQNKLFYIQAEEVAISNSYSTKNDLIHDLYPSTHLMGIRSPRSVLRDSNITGSSTDKGSCFASFNRFNSILIENSIFSNNRGEYGFHLHGLSNAFGEINHCLFSNNEMETNNIMKTDSQVIAESCFFLMKPFSVDYEVNDSSITISSSMFNGTEREWLSISSMINFVSPIFGLINTKKIDIDIIDASLICRLHEKKFKKEFNNRKSQISTIRFLNFTMTYLPFATVIFAFITCVLYVKNKPNTKQIPSALLLK